MVYSDNKEIGREGGVETADRSEHEHKHKHR